MMIKRLLLGAFSLSLITVFGGVSIPVQPAIAESRFEERTGINVYKLVSPAVVTIGTGTGSGSGTIIRADGLVLTNDHVVQGTKDGRVVVRSAKGKRYIGQLVALDRRNDLALIKLLTTERFPFVPIASSDGIEVGQQVFAIGSPYGLSGTLTTGILSRIAPNGDLQTDAALNYGNSGGPLLNSRGQLIGVNKAILSPAGQGNIGIGFATSAIVAKNFIAQNQNRSTPEVTVAGRSVPNIPKTTVATRSVPNIPRTTVPKTANRQQLGVNINADTFVIEQVQPGSLADNVGLMPGDKLVAINDRPVKNIRQLRAFLNKRSSAVVFTVSRNRRLGKIRVQF